jgi:EAL domain-containing protein (putative c-di-GMP-specific phosphodiesterase class I)
MRQLCLSINIGARQFHHAGFVNEVQLALDQSGTRTDQLIFELTDSLLLKNVDNSV